MYQKGFRLETVLKNGNQLGDISSRKLNTDFKPSALVPFKTLMIIMIEDLNLIAVREF